MVPSVIGARGGACTPIRHAQACAMSRSRELGCPRGWETGEESRAPSEALLSTVCRAESWEEGQQGKALGRLCWGPRSRREDVWEALQVQLRAPFAERTRTRTREFARGVGILTGVGIPAQTLGLSVFTCLQELRGGVEGSFLSDKARGREGRRSETRRRGEGYE